MIGERLSKNSCDWVASVCFYRKKIIHYKRRSKHRWEWGRGWRNKNLVGIEEDNSVLRSRSADIGGWWCGRGPRRAPVYLLLARFLFVNLFIAVASLFTWRGRREGVSWIGERISWKFGDFLSCIQYLCIYLSIYQSIYQSMLSGRRASVDELKDFLKKMDMSIALGRQEP